MLYLYTLLMLYSCFTRSRGIGGGELDIVFNPYSIGIGGGDLDIVFNPYSRGIGGGDLDIMFVSNPYSGGIGGGDLDIVRHGDMKKNKKLRGTPSLDLTLSIHNKQKSGPHTLDPSVLVFSLSLIDC